MKTYYVEAYISKAQEALYTKLKDTSWTQPCLGRIAGVPVALIDITLETLKSPLQIIEGLALAIINLLGGLFHDNCTIKGFLLGMERAFTFAGHTPVAIVLAPFKFTHQAVSNVYAPRKSVPYNGATALIQILYDHQCCDDERIFTDVF